MPRIIRANRNCPNQLDQRVLFSTIFQKISIPTMPSRWFTARLASSTVLKALKVQLLKDPNEKPETMPSLQNAKQQSSMNYCMRKWDKMNISQLKFGHLPDHDFSVLWDFGVAHRSEAARQSSTDNWIGMMHPISTNWWMATTWLSNLLESQNTR